MIKKLLSVSFILLIVCTLSPSSSSHINFNIDSILSTAYAKHKILSSIKIASPSVCWGCSLLMNALMEYTVKSEVKIDDFIMNHFCTMFPNELKSICGEIVKDFGPIVITALLHSASSDGACRAIGVCKGLPTCNLFKSGKGPKVQFSNDWAQYLQIEEKGFTSIDEFEGLNFLFSAYQTVIQDSVSRGSPMVGPSEADWFNKMQNEGESPIDWIKALINKLAQNHTSIVDFDNDKFSELSGELRGYNWRGRDCNDNNANIYPGRKTNPSGGLPEDYNCNGISGVDPVTAKSYKDLFCENSGQIGVMVMGDSAGAHAEVPVQWVNGSMWNSSTFHDLIRALSDEVDLPHMSSYTGYADTGYTGPVSSVYKYLVQRNKCNHRDYQNIAVNGVSSRNGMPSFTRLSRDVNNDHPVLLFLELIGNDVCGGAEDFDHWTTPEDFRTNILNILAYLDTVLPAGSHLVSIGVANGSLIYEAVDGRMHPSGVTYNELYDFQNCLGASMCWGWLNTNQTVRDATTARAAELNQVYRDIYSTYQAKNFDFIYYDFPTNEIFNEWIAEGNDVYELIEPVDGFHPSQTFTAKLGDWLWNSLMRDRPQWLGDENPNNDEITKLFGDQGGY